jgi:predicted ATP-dependent endonuclease of OLD family
MESLKAEGTYFIELRLQNIRNFGRDATLKLGDKNGNWVKWNVILGDNGLGKTSLLIALLGTELDKKEETLNLTKPGIEYSKEHCVSSKTFLGTDNIEKSISAKFVLSNDYKEKLGVRKYLPKIPILAYGANRLMSSDRLSEYHYTNTDSLLNDSVRLVNADEWLLQLDYASSKESSVQHLAREKRNEIIDILKSILPDVTNIRFSTPTKDKLIPVVEFETPFGWRSINELSLGYKTMVAWIVDVASRMIDFYDDEDDPLEKPVIILVDEIDLHLHPKWQRRIFDFLADKFPKAQFIVTAHSPLVVQSAPKDANLILLRKAVDENGNNYVEIDNDIESVRSWRLDQIMTSDLFGLESSRGLETENKIQRRTSLLQKKVLSVEESYELKALNEFVYSLPTENNKDDNEAMDIIRKAADYLKRSKGYDKDQKEN